MHCRTIRVLLVDDHPAIREGVALLIARQEDMEVVGQAANGQEAVEMFRQVRPDVTLLDLRMPLMDGLQALQKIREESAAACVVVLSTYDGDEYIYQALRLGARGYLIKEMPVTEVVAALRAVQKGQTYLPTGVAISMIEQIQYPRLTARETEVLEQIAAGHSNREIAEALFISEGTVKAHVNKILEKLKVADRTQAVTVALQRGLVKEWRM